MSSPPPLDVRLPNSTGGSYLTRVSPPTVTHPYWHEQDDGAKVHFTQIMRACPPGGPIDAGALHGDAIATIIRAAVTTHAFAERRRLALAASRLASEVTGLWTT